MVPVARAEETSKAGDEGQDADSSNSYQSSYIGGIGGAISGGVLGTIVGPAGTLGGAVLGFVIGEEYERRIKNSTNNYGDYNDTNTSSSQPSKESIQEDVGPKYLGNYGESYRNYIQFQDLVEIQDWFSETSKRSEWDSLDDSKNIDITKEEIQDLDRGGLIKLAGELRSRRNELDKIASERATKRDSLNSKYREKINKAQEQREKRDELLEQYEEYQEALDKSDKELSEEGQENIVRDAINQKNPTELTNEIDNHHQLMIEAYQDAGDLRMEADVCHEKFLDAKEASDRHHEDFIRVQRRLRELDDGVEDDCEDIHAEEREATKKEAEGFYKKFKKEETKDIEDIFENIDEIDDILEQTDEKSE